MKIIFFKASELETNIKATVHVNGRLGFNSNAHRKLKLDNFKFVNIGCEEGKESDDVLYLQLTNDENADGFSLSIAGGYYYTNARPLFDKLGSDYETKKIIYNISELVIENEVFYKLKKREIERKSDEEIEDEQ